MSLKSLSYAILIMLSLNVRNIDSLGSLAHNYVAKEVMAKAELNPEVFKILKNYTNEYLIGSDFPDTGYMPGATYGELTHHQPFVDAYINYLHGKYKIPSEQRDKLISFLMGICTHNISDEKSHQIYYVWVALEDFKNLPDKDQAFAKAHSAMDPGSDFYVIVNKKIYDHPVYWWVPVNDLVNVYKIMGRDVSAEEIIKANAIYYLAVGLDENLIALPEYLYDRYIEIPWGIQNLETPDTKDKEFGAFPGQINACCDYLNVTWQQYTGSILNYKKNKFKPKRPAFNKVKEFITNEFKEKNIHVNPVIDSQGNAVFNKFNIIKNDRYIEHEKEFISKYKKV